MDCAGILKNKIQTIFNIEKCWKMSENAEEPSQKRQRFADMESEDLNSLLDTAQAQSTKYNTAYTLYLLFCLQR